MRFFEHQENARAQTILLLLFALTVIALVLAVNLALAVTWRAIARRQRLPGLLFHRQHGGDSMNPPPRPRYLTASTALTRLPAAGTRMMPSWPSHAARWAT